MPIGQHLSKCRECGKEFIVGDCILNTCHECECKIHGHTWLMDICGRCGAKRSAMRPKAEMANKHASIFQSQVEHLASEVARMTALVQELESRLLAAAQADADMRAGLVEIARRNGSNEELDIRIADLLGLTVAELQQRIAHG